MSKTTTPRAPRAPRTPRTPKTDATRAPRVSKRVAAQTARDELARQAAIAAIHIPTKEQIDAEAAAAQAEEAANLAKEAAELAAEQPVVEGYTGPMLALREAAKAGRYTKALNGNPCCNDAIALALGKLDPLFVISACMIALALPNNPYMHLNIGQQSMNLRNRVRGAMKRNELEIGVVLMAADTAEQMQDHERAARATPAAQT